MNITTYCTRCLRNMCSKITFGIRSAGGSTFLVARMQYTIIETPTMRISTTRVQPATRMTMDMCSVKEMAEKKATGKTQR